MKRRFENFYKVNDYIKAIDEAYEEDTLDIEDIEAIQKKLDELSDEYQEDEKLGSKRYLLYQLQAMLYIAQNELELADGFLEDAESTKGDSDFSSVIIDDHLRGRIYYPDDEDIDRQENPNRLNRRSYIVGVLLGYMAMFIGVFLDILLFAIVGFDVFLLTLLGAIIGSVYIIRVAIRRLHDMDRSGWEVLIALIPIFGLVIGVLLLFQKGTEGQNKYGEPVEGIKIFWD